MTTRHFHTIRNHNTSPVGNHKLLGTTGSMKSHEDSSSVALTGDGVGKSLIEANTLTSTLSHENLAGLWRNIERVRKSGKVSIDGTGLDMASVIAVGK